jgi:hypothetical protein
MTAIKLPKYVREIENRHGNPRLQFQRRRGSPKHIMLAEPGTAAFTTEYHSLMAGLSPAVLADAAPTKSERHLDQYDDSVGAMCTAYFASDKFQGQHADSQMKVRRLINNCLVAEVPFKGKPRALAKWPCDMVSPTDMRAVRSALKPARKTKDPKARHFRDQHMETFRGVWNWALEFWTAHQDDGVVHLVTKANPAARMEPLAPESDGWHTMTERENATFNAKFPLGTVPHLAMAVLRYTMVRRSDAAMLGAPMLEQIDGALCLRFIETKLKDRAPKERILPVSDKLRDVLKATPGALQRETFIVGEQGERMLPASFGELFKEWLVEAGLSHCSCHSVRKFVATDLADRKASAHTIRALGGWTNLRQVQRYTKKGDERRLSAAAVEML